MWVTTRVFPMELNSSGPSSPIVFNQSEARKNQLLLSLITLNKPLLS